MISMNKEDKCQRINAPVMLLTFHRIIKRVRGTEALYSSSAVNVSMAGGWWGAEKICK